MLELLCSLLLGAAPACPTPAHPPAVNALRGTPVLQGYAMPLGMVPLPGSATAFLVLEQGGRVWRADVATGARQPWVDLRDRVTEDVAGSEQGLLGLALHPQFARNGRAFVNYTDRQGDTVVAELKATASQADPASERRLLFVDQPYPNHNGGHLAFDPSGMLVIGMGDGGSRGDPQRHAQNKQSLLGKMLRLDVDRGRPYAIPADNPFARGGGKPEIWHWGLRNPWRFSYDLATDDLYIADVGQNAEEEVHVDLGRNGGRNYGWPIMEGKRCYQAASCNRQGLTLPPVSYTRREGGCSVSGGFVYRGCKMPALRGTYFYSDYCDGRLRSFRYEGGQVRQAKVWTELHMGNVSAFGQGNDGELYAIDHGGGRILRLEPR